jgi:tetratricopeptide (TPR) repeat protein
MAKLTVDTANILFNAGTKYEEAVSYYRRLEQIDPQNEQMPFSLYQQALSLYRRNTITKPPKPGKNFRWITRGTTRGGVALPGVPHAF